MVNVFDIALAILYRNRLRAALAMLDHYGSAQEAWNHLNEPGKKDALEHAKRELDWIQEHGIRVYTLSDDDYPYRLRQCPDRPLLLYGKGNLHPSDGHVVSIVGTRQPTEYGKELTARLVRDLHEQLDQLTVVSGGAYGIDITAHRAALQYGVPTIIIPAHGLDRIYPYRHRPEAVQALERGGLLTEFPSGTEPVASNFIQRNRIVAGLADAVVVVESKEKGGSLITAGMAVDYDRDLFAFPGRPDDVSSQGCNALIRAHGAQLITCADDLTEAMGWTTKKTSGRSIQTTMAGLMSDLTPAQQTIAAKLQEAEEGLNVNLIVMETGLSYSEVSSELVLMELQGMVRALPGGIYRIVR